MTLPHWIYHQVLHQIEFHQQLPQLIVSQLLQLQLVKLYQVLQQLLQLMVNQLLQLQLIKFYQVLQQLLQLTQMLQLLQLT